MAQELGRALVIKRDSGGGSYVFVCGFRTPSFQINNNLVDVSVPDCDDPLQVVLESMAFGIQTMQFSGSGLFDSDEVGQAVADDCLNQVDDQNYQVIVPGWKTFTGIWIVESINWNGSVEGNLEFEATFRAKPPQTVTTSA